MVGATGAITPFAARGAVAPETLLDDVLAVRIALGGYRVVFRPSDRLRHPSPDAVTERRRKVRTLAGNYQLVRLEPRLLVPGANPLFVQFVSHKMGRLIVPYALIALLVSSAALASAGAVYGLALVVQVTFYVLALHGAAAAASGQSEAHGKELVNAELD